MSTLHDGPKSGPVLSTPPIHLVVPADVIAEADRSLEAFDALMGDGPPTDRRAPLSQVAVRSDGQLLISTEDAVGFVNLEGRTLQTFLVLTDEEALFVRESTHDHLSECAAHVLGKLPRVTP